MATTSRNKQEIVREAMGIIGSIKTPKKAASSAANGKRRGMLPLEALQCTCGKCPDNPKTYCPRGRAIIRRRAKAQGTEPVTSTIEYSKVDSASDADALLDATGEAARRAGYRTDQDIDRLIDEVRAELGHDAPRRALRERRISAQQAGAGI